MRFWFLRYLQVSDLIDQVSLQALRFYPKDMEAGPPRGEGWVCNVQAEAISTYIPSKSQLKQ